MIALATDDDGSEETSYGIDHYVPITDCSTHKKKMYQYNRYERNSYKKIHIQFNEILLFTSNQSQLYP